MATYLEVKKYVGKLLRYDKEVDEECDLLLDDPRKQAKIVVSNDDLKRAFENLSTYNKENLELYSKDYREIPLRIAGPNTFYFRKRDYNVTDGIHGITYSMYLPSLEYCLFVIDSIVEYNENNDDSPIIITPKHYAWGLNNEFLCNTLSSLLGIRTLKVRSNEEKTINELRNYSTAFEFKMMYKTGTSVSEYLSLEDMYIWRSLIAHNYYDDKETPPYKSVIDDALIYYTMALESRDPFTVYISFYHILEYFYDEVFKAELTEKIKKKITHPDFSYNSKDKLYELAKMIKKEMNSDGESGKGDELKSLGYVLKKYVPINELIDRIDYLDKNAKDYYQNNKVPFVKSSKTQIAWKNLTGVYTNLANRIYETRNSLVHSKSEHKESQYKPYKNNNELKAEIALIQAVAEIVLINSGKDL